MSARRPLLLMASLTAVIAACSGGGGDDDDGGTAGSIDVTISCVAPTCGLTGTLRIPVYEEACTGSPLITITDPGVTLSSSLAATNTVNGLEAGGAYCLEVFLDVDTSGTLSSGDAIASAGSNDVVPDPEVGTSFLLDALE